MLSFKEIHKQLIIVLLVLAISGCFTNDPYPSHIKFSNNEAELNQIQQQKMLHQVDSLLNRRYIKQNEIEFKLSKLKNIQADSIALASDFAQQVTLTLREAFNDKHLALYYDTALIKRLTYEQRKGPNWNDVQFYEAYVEHSDLVKSHNFDFEKIEILDGNVGYLKFNYFAKLKDAQATINAAMQFVSNCDALIIDLQENAGGHVNTAQYITSFFYPENTTLFFRNLKDETEIEYVAEPNDPVSLINVPLYIIVNERTASAAEIITNTFIETKRAKVVGNLTWGGAHACSLVILNEAFALQLPFSELTGPVSKTNWEAKGIEPHITKAAENIIDNVHHLAVSYLLDNAAMAKAKRKYKGILKSIEAKFNDDLPNFSEYTGNYGSRKFELKNDELYYEKIGGRPIKLVHVSGDEFVLQSNRFETVYFNRSKRGSVYAANFIKSTGDTLSYLIDERDFNKR